MSRFTPYYIYILLICWFCISPVFGQIPSNSPKRESRAVWLTTLYGLDWPKTSANSALGREQQQKEFCNILDKLQAIHINTILLQTRVRGTVIYPSALEPWDNALTGTFGSNPGYDPLAFAIEECHKRGMELHAWIVTMPCFRTDAAKKMGKTSVLRKHPELCKRHNGMWYLDPGMPGTTKYLSDICKEIVTHYDVDGIHFDYLRYPENATTFPDRDTYRRYGKGQDKAQWRRNNLTQMVRTLYKDIKNIKPWVRVSSSPIGKFANLSRFSAGGWNARDAVHQDAQGWLREGIHDMLFPMMYFQGNHFYPFAADWNEQAYGKPIVPGLGIYFLSPEEKNWPLDIIVRELQVVRSWNLGGQAYFRSQFLTDNVKGLYDYLKRDFYAYPALTPRYYSSDSIAPSRPEWLPSIRLSKNHEILFWTSATDNTCKQNVRYNLYASRHYPVNTDKAENLIATYLTDTTYAINAQKCENLHFAVTAIDRYGNESAPSYPQRKVLPQMPTKGMAHNGKTLSLPYIDTEFVMVTDQAGHVICTEKYSQQIDISKLKPGVYRVRTLEKRGISRHIGWLYI